MATTSNQPYSSSPTTRSYEASHTEGKLTRQVEMQTSRVPSLWFLGAAGASVAASLALKIAGYDKTANFVGQWAPTILLLGIYNKLVKEHAY